MTFTKQRHATAVKPKTALATACFVSVFEAAKYQSPPITAVNRGGILYSVSFIPRK